LKVNTEGDYNTAVGDLALQASTTGSSNTALGESALRVLTTGTKNVAAGNATLDACTTGDENTALGYAALGANTTATSNTVIGCEVAKNVTTGGENVIIGAGIGSIADTLTSGGRNVMVARNADFAASNRSDSLVIAAGNALVTDMGEGTSWIGAHDSGGTSGNVYRAQNESTWDTTSDQRIKKNIVNNNTGLSLLNQVQVRNFEYRTESEITDFDKPENVVVRSPGTKLGVIAQEVKEIIPGIVEEGQDGCLVVKPDNITWYLVNAIKELSAKVTALEAK